MYIDIHISPLCFDIYIESKIYVYIYIVLLSSLSNNVYIYIYIYILKQRGDICISIYMYIDKNIYIKSKR